MDEISLRMLRASVGERRRGRRAKYGHALLDELEKYWATGVPGRVDVDELEDELDLVLGATCPAWRDAFPRPAKVRR